MQPAPVDGRDPVKARAAKVPVLPVSLAAKRDSGIWARSYWAVSRPRPRPIEVPDPEGDV